MLGFVFRIWVIYAKFNNSLGILKWEWIPKYPGEAADPLQVICKLCHIKPTQDIKSNPHYRSMAIYALYMRR